MSGLRRATWLYHTAILYPTRTSLADALRRVLRAHIPLEGAADHGVSQSIYLRDPDDNGVELYCDKPKDQWPRTPDGKLAMFTRPLDLTGLLSEAPADVPPQLRPTRPVSTFVIVSASKFVWRGRPRPRKAREIPKRQRKDYFPTPGQG